MGTNSTTSKYVTEELKDSAKPSNMSEEVGNYSEFSNEKDRNIPDRNVSSPTKKRQSNFETPWKRKVNIKKVKKDETERNTNQQKSLSTFTGERGGPAEDAELLAELRAIS